MKYVTASEMAKKWAILQGCVQILCSENRIEGVFYWVKRGQYLKRRKNLWILE